MRKQIAAANWKMNLTIQEGTKLTEGLLSEEYNLGDDQLVVLSVPFPYLGKVAEILEKRNGFEVAAQNLSDKENGAYTGETSATMLQSMGIKYVLIGHSERREYFFEDNLLLAAKTDAALAHDLLPIFCCGEPLTVREGNTQNEYVALQLDKSLFHLNAEAVQKVVIAYEPIWAIGTGKTASSEQAQEMHAHIRAVFAGKYGEAVANNISILYGGSVKAANAAEIFSQPDVDGGLVGGASLVEKEFTAIIKALK